MSEQTTVPNQSNPTNQGSAANQTRPASKGNITNNHGCAEALGFSPLGSAPATRACRLPPKAQVRQATGFSPWLLTSSAASLAKRASLWAITSIFILLLSAALIGQAFTQKFFDQNVYFSSLEKHGLYGGMQEGMVALFSSNLPPEIRENATSILSSAVTLDYVRAQSNAFITNFLAYFSSKSETLDLALDLSPIKRGFSASQGMAMQLIGAQMPQTMDFTSQLRDSGQLAKMAKIRSQIAQAEALNGYAYAISLFLLALFFLLNGGGREGIAKCAGLVFSTGISAFMGGAAFALLSPMGVSAIAGASAQGEAVSNAVSLVMSDVMQEVGVLTIIYSLPLLAIGFLLPHALNLFWKTRQPDGGLPSAP